MKSLTQILSDGTLVDNSVYTAQRSEFRVGRGKPVEIRDGRGPNKRLAGWHLLQKASELDFSNSKLIFRFPDADYDHNTEDALVTLVGHDPLNFGVRTGNLIGCVKFDGSTLSVSSRFGDEFIKYIIADADGFVELPEQGGTERGGYEWLLIYLWLVKLNKAFRLGVPKAYATRSESLTRVRGRLDPVHFYRSHERGSYYCTYREHSYDNDTTRLVAHTLRHLDHHGFLRDSHALNQTFQMATQGQQSPLQKLLAAEPVRNSYYSDYNPVIELSKIILQSRALAVGSQSQTSAFLFDVSMLFEYFIRKLLKRAGAVLRSKSDRSWKVPAGHPTYWRKLFPDLVFEIDELLYVFDVKYKSFDFRHGVEREDLFQLHTYVGQVLNEHAVAGCGFIYPIRESRWAACGLQATQGVLTQPLVQGGRTIPFHVAFLRVPEQGNLSSQDWARMSRNAFQDSASNFVEGFSDRLRATAW